MTIEKILYVCWTIILLPVFLSASGGSEGRFAMVLTYHIPYKYYLFLAPIYVFVVWGIGCVIIHLIASLIKSLRA